MSETPEAPRPVVVSGTFPDERITSGPFYGIEVRMSEKRRDAWRDYQDSLQDDVTATIIETMTQWEGRTP